ncbi:MAG: amidohydrolase family protein, partial [Comamonas sp.]
MPHFDMLICNGCVVDGTGAPPFPADVAVLDGRIAAIGHQLGSASQTIDATGLLVTPGFVDVHTHFDGQATWDERLWPTSQQGVTTAVMGNCGVGFAPCRPEDRDTLIALMEGVEDIPDTALHEGLPWTWESFPEYLDALGERRYDIDIAALLPHGPLRVYAMGERAVRREPASEQDLQTMQQLVQQGLAAGAVGLSTSRTMA